MEPYKKIICGHYIDSYNHMNNARYLELFEEARWHFWYDLVDALRDMGAGFAIVNINIDYKYPANCRDIVLIDAEVSKVNNSSLVVKQTMVNQKTGKLLSEALFTMVIFDLKENRPKKIDNKLKELLEPWMA